MKLWTKIVATLGLLAVLAAPAIATWTLPVPYHPDQATGDLLALSVSGGKTELLSVPAVAAGRVLISAGTGTAPAWSATAAVNGVTPAGGTLTVTGVLAQVGNATVTGTFGTTGNTSIGDANADAHASLGSWTGFRPLALVHTSGNLTLTNAHCGRTIIDNATSAAQTFTLPAVADVPGCQIKFIAGHADGEILINMAASGTCVITTFAAVGADADTAIVTDASCDTGLKNTAATNAIGDSLTLVSDGTRWLGVGITSGIWTSQ